MLAPSWIIDEPEKVVLPYRLDAMTQIAGEVALDHGDAMNARAARLVEERVGFNGLADLPVDVWPSGANFVLIDPVTGPATTSGRASSTDPCWSVTARRGLGSMVV